MKKSCSIFALVAALLLVAMPAKAADTGDADKAHFGVRLQFDMNTSTKYSHMFHFGPGVSAGINYYAPFGKITYFNTELLFSYDTFGYEGDTENKYNRRHLDGSLNMLGLRLPLQIGVKFIDKAKLRLSAYTGPAFYFNFSLKADYTETSSRGSEKVKKDYSNSGAEMGWTLGVAADFSRRWHAHVQGTLGLTNMGMTDDLGTGRNGANFKRAEISVGVGYNF
ncbi:MAG: PorT family protein [Bacteroidales bacterium]|nr:PorT family protein [Bacteroidales bacterium]MDY2916778.1 outer membrane beta-barrel protein [Muribaculaceae bacterium]